MQALLRARLRVRHFARYGMDAPFTERLDDERLSVLSCHRKTRGFYFPALANTPVPENKKLRLCSPAVCQ